MRCAYRNYERRGVLPKPDRQDNNNRLYPSSAVERVRLIRSALAIGFSIDEMAGILDERRQGGIPCRRVRDLAQAKLDQVDELIRILGAKRDDLSGLLATWETQLAATPDGMRAGLLETMKRLRKQITYRFESTTAGAQVRLGTRNKRHTSDP